MRMCIAFKIEDGTMLIISAHNLISRPPPAFINGTPANKHYFHKYFMIYNFDAGVADFPYADYSFSSGA